jgi:hypothetical protein
MESGVYMEEGLLNLTQAIDHNGNAIYCPRSPLPLPAFA